jgi:hypothetical protein
MKRKRQKASKIHKEMTDKEFVEFLEKLWTIDPKEGKRLLEESFKREYQKFLRGEDE